jgi:hypothetical protein
MGAIAEKVQTHRFFDGWCWEATCPVGWDFRQDKSVRGYPYVFETAPAFRLQLGTGRDSRVNFGEGLTRPGISSEAVRIAYVLTLQDARMRNSSGGWAGFLFGPSLSKFDSLVESHDFGAISGFTSRGTGNLVWSGHFSAEPYAIYASFSGTGERVPQMSMEALSIVGSIRFRKVDDAA